MHNVPEKKDRVKRELKRESEKRVEKRVEKIIYYSQIEFSILHN